MALPEDHLAKFHKMTDAKEIWKAIKSRFGGNDESKKMQKYFLKQQFEGFSVSNSEGLHKSLVTLDGEGVDWTSHSEDEQENYALMACSSSGLDTEREQLGDDSIEIQAYTQALKKVEAQLVAHQQSMRKR
ncbi:hypothetical protein Tco_0980927 [Tanacetum coccineum]